MPRPRFHPLRITAIRQDTPEAVVLTLEVPPDLQKAYRFTPGQYLTLRTTIEGQDVRRSYSICSAPTDPTLQVGIKRVEGGLFSTWANTELKPGDTIQVKTPEGRFGLTPDPQATRTYAAFAAGSGITPILSLVKTLLPAEPAARFFLFCGNRTTDSIMFRSEIEDLKDKYLSRLSVFHVLSREDQDTPILNGHLDAEKLRALAKMLPKIDHAFVCGPQPMIEALPKALAQLGIPHIHTERFTPAADARTAPRPIPANEQPAAMVAIVYEGTRTEIPVAKNETIIDAAIRAGRNPPFSCKAGMCCTCRAKLLDGKVEMAVNYSLEPWEIAAGFVLTCQATPTTDRVTIDYDQV